MGAFKGKFFQSRRMWDSIIWILNALIKLDTKKSFQFLKPSFTTILIPEPW